MHHCRVSRRVVVKRSWIFLREKYIIKRTERWRKRNSSGSPQRLRNWKMDRWRRSILNSERIEFWIQRVEQNHPWLLQQLIFEHRPTNRRVRWTPFVFKCPGTIRRSSSPAPVSHLGRWLNEWLAGWRLKAVYPSCSTLHNLTHFLRASALNVWFFSFSIHFKWNHLASMLSSRPFIHRKPSRQTPRIASSLYRHDSEDAEADRTYVHSSQPEVSYYHVSIFISSSRFLKFPNKASTMMMKTGVNVVTLALLPCCRSVPWP